VSEQSLYVWRKRFGAMSVDEAKRLEALEAENTRLKKLLAELFVRPPTGSAGLTTPTVLAAWSGPSS
jgi:hypothetical protein